MDLNMSPSQQQWYKDQFSDKNLLAWLEPLQFLLLHCQKADPPPPPDIARKKLKDINRVVYGDIKNDNSPKMIS